MALNDRTYEEKRNFIRMTMNASANLTLDNGQSIEVTCIDLSASGMSIKANEAVKEGETIHVSIESPNEQFRSMDANGKVLRCREMGNGEYDLGIEINTFK
jgi:hypothetical protein